MDQDKNKSSSSATVSKNSSKSQQQRHQEHNYTNPPIDETTTTKSEATNDSTSIHSGKTLQRTISSGPRLGNGSQYKVENQQMNQVREQH